MSPGAGKKYTARHQEVYYDCLSCDWEEHKPAIVQQNLQMFEVIDKIENAKEFKGLLKQIAYNSHVLYQAFRQAYAKAKKTKRKLLNNVECDKASPKADAMLRNPGDGINREVPAKKQALPATPLFTAKAIKQKRQPHNDWLNQHEYCCYLCKPCSKLEGKKTICPVCLGSLEAELVTACTKHLYSEETEHCEEIGTVAVDTASCLNESGICAQYEEDLQQLNFCDRCAVLRGEMAWPNKVAEEEPAVIEQIPQTKQSEINTQILKSSNQTQTAKKQVSNLSPVSVNIPLKLQIEGQNCQTLSIETEIQIAALADNRIGSLTCLQKQSIVENSTTKLVESSSKTVKVSEIEKWASDTFYSCNSNSDIIVRTEIPNIADEAPLNEVLEMMRRLMPSFRETMATQKNVESRGIQAGAQELPAITHSPASETNFTQTVEELALEIYPEKRARKPKAELLEQIRAVLETNTTKEGLKALKQGTRFSLPTYLEQSKKLTATTTIFSAPSHSTAITAGVRPIQPLPPFPGFKPTVSKKPPLPPKPVLSAKPEAIQTGNSAIRSNEHYKRREMRSELREKLEVLLTKSKTGENNDILLHLFQLFHPLVAENLPKEIKLGIVLQDIEYLLQPEDFEHEYTRSTTYPSTSHSFSDSGSQESILRNVKSILNSKSKQIFEKETKYNEEIKQNILENLYDLITPTTEKTPLNRSTASGILKNLHQMLKPGPETAHPQSQGFQHLPTGNSGPGPSGTQQTANVLRESVFGDLKYLLERTNLPQPRNSLQENVKAASYDESLSDNEDSL